MFYIFNKSDEWEEHDWAVVWFFETFLSGYLLEFGESLRCVALREMTARIWKSWRIYANNSRYMQEVYLMSVSKGTRQRLLGLITESLLYCEKHFCAMRPEVILRKSVLMECINSSVEFRELLQSE